jgi:DNA polymerase-3 subunit gamma/tau
LSTLFEKIKLANVEEIYGLININNKINLLNLIFSHSYQDLIIAINEYDKKGIDFYILLNDLLEIILDKLIFIKTNNFILLKKLTSLNVDDIKTENIEKLIEVADI